MNEVNMHRWQLAQEAESTYWQVAGNDAAEMLRIIHEKVAALQWAQQTVDKLLTCDGALVEIGIGPLGIGCIHFFKKSLSHDRELIGIDPLPSDTALDTASETMPAVLGALLYACHTGQYRQILGMGEKLDIPTGSAAFVACYNVLDHCQDPRKVLIEVARVLKPLGTFLLGCDVYSLAGIMKYRIQKVIDRVRYSNLDSIGYLAHPYQFIAHDLEKLVQDESVGLQILAINSRPFESLHRIWSHSHRMIIVAHKPR